MPSKGKTLCSFGCSWDWNNENLKTAICSMTTTVKIWSGLSWLVASKMFPQKKSHLEMSFIWKEIPCMLQLWKSWECSPPFSTEGGVPSGPAPTALTTPEVIAHLFCQVRDCFSRALHCLVSSCHRVHLGLETPGFGRPCPYALVPLLSWHFSSFWTKKHIYFISESVLLHFQMCLTITCSYLGPFPIGFHVRVTRCLGLPGTKGCVRMPELGKPPPPQGWGGHPIKSINLNKGHLG